MRLFLASLTFTLLLSGGIIRPASAQCRYPCKLPPVHLCHQHHCIKI